MSQPWTHTPYSKAYERVDEHYVEPEWVSQRLFEEEKFNGRIYDPACGFGRIVLAAMTAGHRAYGSDIVYRGWDTTLQDFIHHDGMHDNIVTNPPFDRMELFTMRALECSRYKAAIIFPTARLNAARWLDATPLQTVWLLTPRPSMPPGHVIKAGGKVGGGKSDYCWLVFERGYSGEPVMKWLRRDVN